MNNCIVEYTDFLKLKGLSDIKFKVSDIDWAGELSKKMNPQKEKMMTMKKMKKMFIKKGLPKKSLQYLLVPENMIIKYYLIGLKDLSMN